jgi:drug/metabolite transporter (DMT)-like permease
MKVTVAFVLMIICTIGANVLMKLGAMSTGAHRVLGIVDWKTLVGLASFGAAGLIYAWILEFLPLNIAQSFMAAQFIAVILASSLLLSEPIPPGRWLGMACIFVGIIIVAATVPLDKGFEFGND